MRILIIGGTGTVGSQIALNLAGRGESVRVMTRSAEKAKAVPRGVEAVTGDLDTPASLAGAFRDVDAVFLATPLSPTETQAGLAAVAAARSAGVRRLVYMSVHNLERAPHIPHFKSKLPIEKSVRESGLEYTILAPNNFFQNDLWMREAIVRWGVYPQPIGNVGLNRVDVRDIADAAARALTEPGHNGKKYPLVGPDLLTGESTAQIYSRRLGREVRYAGDNLDLWAEQMRRMLPDWMVGDLRIMYEYLQAHGLPAAKEDLDQQAAILGHAPRSFDAFVAGLAPEWRA